MKISTKKSVMRIKIGFTAIFIMFTFQIFGQSPPDSLSIDSCIIYAENNFPVLKNNILNDKISSLQNKNYTSNFYPHIDFEAKASYQSQTIDIAIDTQGLPPGAAFTFPTPPLDQYALTLNLTQNIYDGGITKHLKQIDNQKLKLNNLNNTLSFYQIKKQINEIYFGILILQKTKEQIIQSEKELESRKKALLSSVKNGLLTQDNLDLLSANILILKQKFIEIQENINGLYRTLSVLTGKKFIEHTKFKIPHDIKITNNNNRPEIKILNTKNELSETNINLLKSKRLPKIGAFAIGGYGNPGLTLIKDEWSPYFIVGAKLQWTVWDWNYVSREKQILKLKEASIENQKTRFNQSVNIQTNKLNSEIKKYTELINYDLKIIELHKKICKETARKLQNGTVNSADYISTLNAKEQANIQYEIHKLKLLKCKYDYLIATGNF